MNGREGLKNRGVPLGGTAAGSIELSGDGCFRNIAINNNRTPQSRIPESTASFIAVRAAGPGGVYARILQRAPKDAPPPQGMEPPRLSKETLAWRALYPASHYYLNDPSCPAQIVWTAFAPIVPFDHDGSTLPALFSSIRFTNSTDVPLEVSAVFNWENLCGRSQTRRGADRAPIVPACVEDEDPVRLLKEPPPDADGHPRFNALEFGAPEPAYHDADGHYCLLAKRTHLTEISVLAWDHESPEDQSLFWERFVDRGTLARAGSRSGVQRSGAVCCSMSLPPRSECRVDFVLAWYCPRFEANPAGAGNGYTNRYHSAVEVALQCVKHLVYFSNAVENWQKRILSSSLPPWFTRMLVNSASVFSSNAFLSRDGRFAMSESTTASAPVPLETRLYSSLGTLLFLPRFEDHDLVRLAKDLRTPSGKEPKETAVDRCAHFVLSACRNYLFTGSLPRIQALLPTMHDALAAMLGLDTDSDGIPDPEASRTYDGILTRGPNSYASGLWIAALAAYARLTRHLRLQDEAAAYEAVLGKARRSFERLFWDDERGFYRLGRDSKDAVCHTGQLAGQWYADVLGLGTLFEPGRVSRALDALLRYNVQANGVADAVLPNAPAAKAELQVAWPLYTAAHFVCLLIFRNRVEEAMRLLEQHFRSLHDLRVSMFDIPLKWDLRTNQPDPCNPERHAGTLAIWYVFQALCGFEMNVPERCLRIRPHLPPGLRSFESPVFTPACLGWLQFQEETTEGFLQRVRVSFDSPVSIATIELRVPKGMETVRLWCEDASGFLDVAYSLRPDEVGQRLTIHGKRIMTISGTLTIRVANGEPKRPQP